MSPKTSRKLVHIGVSHWWLFAMFWIENPIIASIGPAVFIILNWISIQTNAFKGMNIEASRHNYGTVYFPLSLLLLVLASWYDFMPKWTAGTAILVLGWGDGLAAIVGEGVPSPSGNVFGWRKSMAGTIAMFTVSSLVVFLMTRAFNPEITLWNVLLRSIGTGLVAAYLEVFSPFGLDNLTVPLGTALYFYYISPLTLNTSFIFAFSCLAAAAYAAWYKHAVTAEGALAGLGLGTVIYMGAGLGGLLVLAAFFISSTMASRIRKEQKERLGLQRIHEKGDRRDAIQVFANGGVGMLSSVLYAFTGSQLFLIALLVSFAAATADTWASELGVLNRGKPRSIINFKPLEPGFSGGVSPFGFAASLLGSLIIAILVFVIAPFQAHKALVPVLIGGFMGALFDSFLGATIQAQYRCAETGELVERPYTGDMKNKLIKGFTWMNNDMVNFLSILVATFLTSFWYMAIQ
ncbi:DUF92 domain-containing protein [Gracilinema caldarium]|nr:DUF92 domain-containing protein [Gracilinema caldarium]